MAVASIRMREYGSRVVSLFRDSKCTRPFKHLPSVGVLFTAPTLPSKCICSFTTHSVLGLGKISTSPRGVLNSAHSLMPDLSIAANVGSLGLEESTCSPRKVVYLLKGKLPGKRELSFRPNSFKSEVLSETHKEQPNKLPKTGGTALLAEWQLSSKQLKQIDTFVDLLLNWNQRMNLTAVTERDAVLERHIIDSLALLPVIERALFETASSSGSQSSSDSLLPDLDHASAPLNDNHLTSTDFQNLEDIPTTIEKKKGARRKKKHKDSAVDLETGPGDLSHQGGVKRLRVIDVGTGAGLPGLVFAIARPEWDLVLVESLRKRCTFLEEVVRVAGLNNVSVVWGRAEDTVRLPNMRASADVAVARAVADLRVLSELCIPYVRKGGLFVAPKGPTPEDEVAAALGAIETLGGRVLATEKVASSGPGGQRTALVCLKERTTPAKYPRRAGVPAKSPL